MRRLLSVRLRERWPVVGGMTVIGLGFASPYLRPFREEAASVAALMPAAQGALIWPAAGLVKTALVDEHTLPLPDASVDKVLAVHCLEMSQSVRPMLREIWRVLKPEGSMVMVVPNRASIWARIEATPFGYGQPYSRSQIERLLADSLFTPVYWSGALHMPPWERRFLLRSAGAWEQVGGTLAPALSGVIIVEAHKELMAPLSGGSRVRATPRLATVLGRD